MRRISLSTKRRSIGRKSSGGMININSDSATVCFDDLFVTLQRFKSESGNLSIPVSHPSFLNILDNLSSFGMEELLTQRWDNQFDSLKEFKSKNKDCLIPPDHPTLGNWAKVQRENYRLCDQRLPSPLTKKRFDKLKSVGFSEFVARGKKGRRKSALAIMEGGARSLESFEDRLRKGPKIQSTKESANPPKPRSHSHEITKSNNQTYEKRMLQRSLSKGLGRMGSKRLVTEVAEEREGNNVADGGASQNLLRYSGLIRSCSASNLCPGSWECSRCSYINEPVGLDLCNTCKMCGAPNDENRHSSNEPTLSKEQSYRLSDSTHKDDMSMNYTSWRDLDDAISVALEQSVMSVQSDVMMNCIKAQASCR